MEKSKIVVLESDRAPGQTVRYVDQVVRFAPPDVGFKFFGWGTAIFGRYDVFHVHWPEFLIRAGSRSKRIVKVVATLLLLCRLTLTRTPIVRTIHNVEPHEAGRRSERALLRWLDGRVTSYIVLNPTTPIPRDARSSLIPHGHYEDVFASLPKSESTSGNFIYFGRIEPYKGVDLLLEAFAGTQVDARLQIVGRGDDDLIAELQSLANKDSRISTHFRFVSDEELVRRVTSAEAVILPYREVHNSGVALVALSLHRPIVVRRSAATEALQREVGKAWVHLYDGDLTPQGLTEVLKLVTSSNTARSELPNLSDRDWKTVARRYAEEFEAAVRKSSRGERAVFVNPSGQRDNLGDSVLRRPYLEALRAMGPLHVYVGNHPSYISGLGIVDGDRVYRSKGRWALACAIAAVSRRAHFAVNAGEIVLDRKYWFTAAWQVPLIALCRVGGGEAVAWGISRRRRPASASLVLRVTVALCSHVTWRDPESPVGPKREVMPDWAFAIASQVDGAAQRSVVALAFRGDRPPLTGEALEALSQFASTRLLDLVVVTQVQRDRDYGRILADTLDAGFVDWAPEASHSDQERLLRLTYSQADCVISDRIHALIIGATEGAAPIGLASTSDEKVKRTFQSITDAPISTSASGMSADELAGFLSTARERGTRVLDSARRAAPVIASATVQRLIDVRRQGTR